MYEYRAATLADAPEMRDLIVRAEAHDSVPRILELDELIEELSADHVDLANNSIVAVVDGGIVGLAYVSFRPSEVLEQRCFLEGTVAPEHRGRGVGRTLVEFGIRRSTETLRAIDDELPKYIRLQGYEQIDSVHRLAARTGFKPVRYFEELLRALVDLPEPRAVDGLTILPWDESRESEILVAKNAAFLDHWGSIPTSESSWNDQLHGFGGRPDLSLFAVDAATNEVVAVLVTARYEADDELLGRSDGWIQTLATVREWRGKGVGSALVVEALHRYRDAGLTHASIGVDSENPSGAARLYRGLGFDLNQRTIIHQIEV